jgi:hypothetical protein
VAAPRSESRSRGETRGFTAIRTREAKSQRIHGRYNTEAGNIGASDRHN